MGNKQEIANGLINQIIKLSDNKEVGDMLQSIDFTDHKSIESVLLKKYPDNEKEIKSSVGKMIDKINSFKNSL